MIQWQYYPKSDSAPDVLLSVVKVFKKHETAIDSDRTRRKGLVSDEVLALIRNDLLKVDFRVETGKKTADKIRVPVLFGRNGKPEKSFEVDAYHEATGTVVEVEAGRALTNYQFLKDLFEACMMHNVNYLVIAVRNMYSKRPDFERIITHFDTLFASGRITLPLKGILIIGD